MYKTSVYTLVNGLCKRYLRDFCVYMGVFGDRPANAANRILPWLTCFCRKAPPLGQIYMKFCIRSHLADIINCAKFYLNQIRGFDSVGGRIFGFPIRKKSRR